MLELIAIFILWIIVSVLATNLEKRITIEIKNSKFID